MKLNLIQRIKNYSFVELSNLRFLNLESNQIQTLDNLAFYNLKPLTLCIIGNNLSEEQISNIKLPLYSIIFSKNKCNTIPVGK